MDLSVLDTLRPPEVVTTARWDLISELVGDGSPVLDIGCRDRGLCAHLAEGIEYVGLDLFPPADVVASAEEPLAFEDDAFECVVFADVLEHLNDPHGALDEGLRVARGGVVVLLPNTYSLIFRLLYAAGRPSGKYRFGAENSLDRHRWLMTFDEARAFVRARAASAGWTVQRECAYMLPFNRASVRTAYRVARAVASPNLWSWEYAARLVPADGGQPVRPVAALA
jgi:SAM-dependent methyltransferase